MSAPDYTVENSVTVQKLLEWRKRIIVPCAKQVYAEVSHSAVMTSVPVVLLLGNHSSGKSSLINHLLGSESQRTGVAPTDDSFTVLMHGDEERRIDGHSLIGNRDLPFKELDQFGPHFIQHLEARCLPKDILKTVHIIDSPGMIDSSNDSLERPYDYIAVVKWLAARCDLVFLLFDPDKPGTTGETLTVLSGALSEIDCNLRIIMNKMDLFDNLRDFSRTFGALCWNLSRSLKTKDLPHVYTTVIPELAKTRANSLPIDDFVQALEELKNYIYELPKYRIAHLINHTTEEAMSLYVRGRVLARLNRMVNQRKWSSVFITVIIAALLGGYSYMQAISGEMMSALTFGALGVGTLLLGAWIIRWLTRFLTRHYLSTMEDIFRAEFRIEIAEPGREEFLSAYFEKVCPKIQRTLKFINLKDMKMLSRTQIQGLRRLIEQDLPALRTQSN